MKKQKRDSIEDLEQVLEKMTSKKYTLSGGYYEIEREGQQCPQKGDVVTQAAIFLPVNNRQELKTYLRLGERVKIAGEGLWGSWGNSTWTEGFSKGKIQQFSAPTWSESFSKAQKWASEELGKFEQILKDRWGLRGRNPRGGGHRRNKMKEIDLCPKIRISYDPIKVELRDQDTGAVLYREDGVGEIDLRQVVRGLEKWSNGDVFSVEDFVSEVLGIRNFQVVK